jgi:hypothetical protein
LLHILRAADFVVPLLGSAASFMTTHVSDFVSTFISSSIASSVSASVPAAASTGVTASAAIFTPVSTAVSYNIGHFRKTIIIKNIQILRKVIY